MKQKFKESKWSNWDSSIRPIQFISYNLKDGAIYNVYKIKKIISLLNLLSNKIKLVMLVNKIVYLKINVKY